MIYVSITCCITEILLDCYSSREGGEDSQHPQLQTVIRNGQSALTQSLQRLKSLDFVPI